MMLTPEDVCLVLSGVTVLAFSVYYLWSWAEYYLQVRAAQKRFRERYWHEKEINRERYALHRLSWYRAVCTVRSLLAHYAGVVCAPLRRRACPRSRG